MDFNDILMGGMPLKKGKDDRRKDSKRPLIAKQKGKRISGAAKMKAEYKARIAKRNEQRQKSKEQKEK